VLRDLVEGFAGRVVDRRAENLDPVEVQDAADDAVPARHEEAEEGIVYGRPLLVRLGEARGVEMGEDVVDPDEGLADRPGETLREAEADEEGADEPGLRGDGYAGEIRGGHARVPERAGDDARDPLGMLAARYLGDDALVLLVKGDLRRDDVGEDGPAVLDDSCGALVAGGLNPEYPHRLLPPRACSGRSWRANSLPRRGGDRDP
jgi:hypothetical protein